MKSWKRLSASILFGLLLAGCSVVHTPREYNLWLTD